MQSKARGREEANEFLGGASSLRPARLYQDPLSVDMGARGPYEKAHSTNTGDPMKLYFAPGACSLSPHIVLRELGLPFELERMDGRSHKTAGGVDFYTINPKGQVPTLQLDDGQI